MMLTKSGSRVLGVYPNARELQHDLSCSSAEVQAVFIDADDEASGIVALAEVRQAHPGLKILLLCEALTPAIARSAIERNVEGVVLKSDSIEEVLLAFNHILDGRAVMPSGWQEVPVDPGEGPVESLSVREREVLELAAAGMRNREIAERLTISPNTVKFHLRTIYSRLGVRNRVQAARAVASVQDDHPMKEK
jgi:DNA-binding NarL/FixJ family response regulator